MRKLFIIAVLAALPLSAYAWGVVSISGGVAGTEEGLSWDNITLFVNWESNDETGDYNLTTTSCGSACEYSAGATAMTKYNASTIEALGTIGSYSMQGTGADLAGYQMTVTDGTEISGTVSSAGFWVYNAGTYLSDVILFRCRSSSSYYGVAVITVNGGDLQLRITDDAGNHDYVTTSLGMAAETWYFVTVAWDFTNDTYYVWVNNTQVISRTTSLNGFTADHILMTGGNYRTISMDSLIVSDHCENLYNWREATGYGE